MPELVKPAEMCCRVLLLLLRRGRGFKSRHPDVKTAAQRLCAIEPRWPRVTNCVTIGFFSGGASLPLRPSRRFTAVVVCRSRLRVPSLGADRDAKPATLIHPANSRNQQVKALNDNEAGVR
jgi:hypothetical protein